MSINGTSWLSNAAHFGTRCARAAVEELLPLISRRSLVNAAGVLIPSQSLTRTRTTMLKIAGIRIGAHSLIQGPVRITGTGKPSDLSFGDHTFVSGHLHVDLGAAVRIGSGVRIGHNVTLLTVNHAIGEPDLRAGTSLNCAIDIGDGAWIASHVTVLPGICIGAGSVVAAGAVVARNVPPNTMVAGVPARPVRDLPPASERLDDAAGTPGG